MSLASRQYKTREETPTITDKNTDKTGAKKTRLLPTTGCSKVRTLPARPPARHKHTDRTDYNTLRR